MTLHAAQTAGYWALFATSAATLIGLAIRRARHQAARQAARRARRRANVQRTLDGMTTQQARRILTAVHEHRHGEHRR